MTRAAQSVQVSEEFLEQDDVDTRSLRAGERRAPRVASARIKSEVEEIWSDLTPDRALRPHEVMVEYQLGIDPPHLGRTYSLGRSGCVISTGRHFEAPLQRGSIWLDVRDRRIRLGGHVIWTSPAEEDAEGKIIAPAQLAFEFDRHSAAIAELLLRTLLSDGTRVRSAWR